MNASTSGSATFNQPSWASASPVGIALTGVSGVTPESAAVGVVGCVCAERLFGSGDVNAVDGLWAKLLGVPNEDVVEFVSVRDRKLLSGTALESTPLFMRDA